MSAPYVITEDEFLEACRRSDRGEPEPTAGPLYEIEWTTLGTSFEGCCARRADDVPKAVEDALRLGATDIIINRV